MFDTRIADSKLMSIFPLLVRRVAIIFDFPRLGGSDFRSAIKDALRVMRFPLSPLVGVPQIVRMCSGVKVFWVEARLIVAMMTD